MNQNIHKKHYLNILKASFFLGLCGFYFQPINAQQKIAPNIYLVKFTDKKNNPYTIAQPQNFLSNKAIERRAKQQIQYAENDLPVNQLYIDSVKNAGFEIINVSKWLNAVSVKVEDTTLFRNLKGMTFIVPYSSSNQQKIIQKQITSKYFEVTESKLKSTSPNYGESFEQISIHNGEYLHSKGFEGQGITIAVFDGGFRSVKDFTSLQNLWFEQRVLHLRDFADKTGDSFYGSLHGSNVLSVMAGYSPENIIGTAPKANYILVHTENTSIYNFQAYEYPAEEFDWVVAAEFADSIGADIISSSLGYNNFLDPSQNYTYRQMDGKTAISSVGAKTAASKGLLVVTSAGNEGENDWKYITAPADADNILTVGAIDIYGNHATFSSVGPTADGRIKPDVVAVGKNTVLQSSQNIFSYANGTSFSAPIISGLAACLWQAAPNASNKQIIEAIKQSSSKALQPDTVDGYGIPNFKKALYMLNPSIFPAEGKLSAYPNPFTTTFTLEFGPFQHTKALLQIENITGKIVYETTINCDPGFPNDLLVTALGDKPRGIYVITVISGNTRLHVQLIKQ